MSAVGGGENVQLEPVVNDRHIHDVRAGSMLCVFLLLLLFISLFIVLMIYTPYFGITVVKEPLLVCTDEPPSSTYMIQRYWEGNRNNGTEIHYVCRRFETLHQTIVCNDGKWLVTFNVNQNCSEALKSEDLRRAVNSTDFASNHSFYNKLLMLSKNDSLKNKFTSMALNNFEVISKSSESAESDFSIEIASSATGFFTATSLQTSFNFSSLSIRRFFNLPKSNPIVFNEVQLTTAEKPHYDHLLHVGNAISMIDKVSSSVADVLTSESNVSAETESISNAVVNTLLAFKPKFSTVASNEIPTSPHTSSMLLTTLLSASTSHGVTPLSSSLSSLAASSVLPATGEMVMHSSFRTLLNTNLFQASTIFSLPMFKHVFIPWRVNQNANLRCADQWLSLGKECLFFNKSRLTHDQAEIICQTQDAHLAKLDDPPIRRIVERYLINRWDALVNPLWYAERTDFFRDNILVLKSLDMCSILHVGTEIQWETTNCKTLASFICSYNI